MLAPGQETLAPKPEDPKDLVTWNEPPVLDPYVPEEDPYPVLPVDFYDNDDGFWDGYLAYKESQYDELPMLIKRTYFKH